MTKLIEAHHLATTRRHLLCHGAAAAFGFTTGAVSPVFAQTARAPGIAQSVPAGTVMPATARIGSLQGGVIGPKFLGLSFEKSSLVPRTLSLKNRDLLHILSAIGPSIMRLGGAASDHLVWVPEGTGNISKQISKADIDSFAPFIAKTGWDVIYGINLAEGSEASAADEAAYVARQLGNRLLCFEIGNEPNLFGKKHPAPDGARSWTFENYRAKWERIRQAISRAVPHAMFSGPDATGGAVDSYAVPFARSVDKSFLKFLSQHHYRLHGDDPSTIAALLETPDPLLTSGSAKRPAILPALKEASQALGVPFRLTEANSAVAGGRRGVSDVFASALWALDFMFTVAKGGGEGVHFHTGRSAAYTPLEFESSKLVAIRPEYYGLLFFKMMGEGKLLEAEIAAGGANISVYALQSSAGISSVVINKDPSIAFKVTLTLPAPVLSASAIGLSAPDLAAKTGIQIQGASISVADGLAPMAPAYALPVSGQVVSFYVPAASALLIKSA